MDIRNDLQGVSAVHGGSVVSKAEKAPGVAAASPVSNGGDEAHLSFAASLMAQAAALPEVRTEKVASVSAALNSGTYEVSSHDVANRLIEHMLGNRE